MRIFRSFRNLVVATLMLAAPLASFAGVYFSASFGPPELPYYEQPLCPGEGYIWTPGYWAYGDEGYFWVPGTWVIAPQVGYLWTPGYWGWGGNEFEFNEGYWGPEVGFYGGIDYGYGYEGRGYEGGRWNHDRFEYNREVNNIDETRITNVYNQTVLNNYSAGRVAYNGGNGGLTLSPNQRELAVVQAPHVRATPIQMQHQQLASSNRMQLASVNHGIPTVAATPQPTAFNVKGVVPARAVATSGMVNNQVNRGGMTPNNGAPTSARQPGNSSYNDGNRAVYQPANPAIRNGGNNGSYNNNQRPLITAGPSTATPTANRQAYQQGNSGYPNANTGRNGNYNNGGNYSSGNYNDGARPPAGTPVQRQQYPDQRQQYSPRQNAQPQYSPQYSQRQNAQPQYAPRQNAQPQYAPQYSQRQNAQPQYAQRQNAQPEYSQRQPSQPQFAPRQSAPVQSAAPRQYSEPRSAPAPAPRNQNAPSPQFDRGSGQPHGGR